MYCDSAGTRGLFGGLLLLSAFATLVAAGCSDITPAPNDTGGGVLESQTNEADQLRNAEEHQEGGGGRR
jgi:hypothetical protein